MKQIEYLYILYLLYGHVVYQNEGKTQGEVIATYISTIGVTICG